MSARTPEGRVECPTCGKWVLMVIHSCKRVPLTVAARYRAGAVPGGLCANREDHAPHVHDSATLGTFWCTADQSQREPGRSERRRHDEH